MEKKIIEVSELPVGEKIYLKKDFLGYRIVHPIKDPETDKIIWVNLLVGGWRNLITLIIVLTFLIWIQWDLHNKLEIYVEKCDMAMKEPVKFCDSLGYYDALEKISKPKFQVSVNGIGNNTT